MKKRYKLLAKFGKIHILRWVTDGVLFGPGWESVATFNDVGSNLERCKKLIRIMNECDKHADRLNNDDRTGNIKG